MKEVYLPSAPQNFQNKFIIIIFKVVLANQSTGRKEGN